MAFGKKKEKNNKKKNRDIAVKEQMVHMSQNPLYPEKQENTSKEVLTAIGTLVLCLLLVAVITKNFSYAFGNVSAYDGMATEDTYYPEEDVDDEQDTDYEMENLEEDVNEEKQMEELPEASLVDADYIIQDSDSRYISESELDGLTKEELSYARNEIYARHGRLFKDEALQNYFDSKDWYDGYISPDSFSEGMLNDYEVKNAATILSYEKSKGYK